MTLVLNVYPMLIYIYNVPPQTNEHLTIIVCKVKDTCHKNITIFISNYLREGQDNIIQQQPIPPSFPSAR